MGLGPSIGELLPTAVGVALSPIPIVAVILMLGTPRAMSNGPAFALGWVVGLVAVSVIVLLVAGDADDPTSSTSTGIAWGRVAIGVVFLALARRQWAARPRPGVEPAEPAWMTTIDQFTAGKALGLGVVLSAVNPKNLALTLAAAASIAQAGLDGGGTTVAVVVFVVIASVTVVGPVVYYLIARDSATGALDTMKRFMAEHNAVIMMVLFLILGVKILGQGLGGLTD